MVSSETPSLRLTPLPSSAYTEAKRVVRLPTGPLTDKQAAELIADLRRSELRKVRALKGAINVHDAQTGYVAKRSKKKGS